MGYLKKDAAGVFVAQLQQHLFGEDLFSFKGMSLGWLEAMFLYTFALPGP